MLDKLFILKRNYSGKELGILIDIISGKGPDIMTETQFKEMKNTTEKISLLTSDNKPYNYGNSIFGKIEIALENYKFDDDGNVIFVADDNDIEEMFKDAGL